MLGHMGTDYPFPLTVRKIHGTETDKQIPECCFMLCALNTASTIKLQGAHRKPDTWVASYWHRWSQIHRPVLRCQLRIQWWCCSACRADVEHESRSQQSHPAPTTSLHVNKQYCIRIITVISATTRFALSDWICTHSSLWHLLRCNTANQQKKSLHSAAFSA